MRIMEKKNANYSMHTTPLSLERGQECTYICMVVYSVGLFVCARGYIQFFPWFYRPPGSCQCTDVWPLLSQQKKLGKITLEMEHDEKQYVVQQDSLSIHSSSHFPTAPKQNLSCLSLQKCFSFHFLYYVSCDNCIYTYHRVSFSLYHIASRTQ